MNWYSGAASALSACLLLVVLASPSIVGAEEPLDLKIINGKVLDGTGNSWFLADVGVREGRVVEVGNLGQREATEVIDAGGLVVAPGFIDVHTHTDSQMFELPIAENFIRNGVTTIVTGNCGGSVTDIREYLDRLDAEPTALNVSTLIGHNTVLRELKGGVAEPLNEEQLAKAREIVRKGMEDGAVGLSTGLIYVPGRWSSTEEIIELQRVAAEYDGIYATHMRSEATEILDAIDEAIRIAEETGSRLQISHFKLPTDMEQKIGQDATMAKVLAARARGLEVWVDQYPYTASSTGITTLFPGWVLEEGSEKAREMLQDPETVERVKGDMAKSQETRMRKDYNFARVASARAYPEYSGKSIREIAEYRRGTPSEEPVTHEEQVETIIDIYLEGGAGMVYHQMSEDSVESIMRSPLVAICSDSGVREFGSGTPHPRGYGTNARVLGEYVRERGVITLEEGIRKMTSMPARAFRFHDRGMIHPGYAADIVIFDPETITDHATFTEPHQYSTGFAWVIVNGVPVVKDDAITGARPGQAIRGAGWRPEKAQKSED
jgi:N-acyl-D-amino-acid deacylase